MRQRQFFGVQRDARNQRAFFVSGLESVIAVSAATARAFCRRKVRRRQFSNRRGAGGRESGGRGRRAVRIQQRVTKRGKFSSTSNRVFDFLPFFGSTRIKPILSGCGASLASTSNWSSGGSPWTSATYFFSGFSELNKLASATSVGFVFGEQNHAAGFEIEPVRVAQIIQMAFARPRFAAGNSGVKQFHQVGPLRDRSGRAKSEDRRVCRARANARPRTRPEFPKIHAWRARRV